jgi:hypothetical protein
MRRLSNRAAMRRFVTTLAASIDRLGARVGSWVAALMRLADGDAVETRRAAMVPVARRVGAARRRR